MPRIFRMSVVALFALGAIGPAMADDKAVTAILDKAIKALGGEEKLAKVKVATWKVKGTLTLNGADNDIDVKYIVRGLDFLRQEFEGEFGGTKIVGAVVLANDKGWRKMGENVMPLDKEGLSNQKRNLYLSVIPSTILPLKSKAFEVEATGEAKVAGKAALAVRATGPDGKKFDLFFDKASGLPVKLVAKVVGFMGEEFTLETIFSDYKEMGGIKKATKLTSTRDGEKFQNYEVTGFEVLGKVEDKTFAEPE